VILDSAIISLELLGSVGIHTLINEKINKTTNSREHLDRKCVGWFKKKVVNRAFSRRYNFHGSFRI
jgi:hypothetical protein